MQTIKTTCLKKSHWAWNSLETPQMEKLMRQKCNWVFKIDETVFFFKHLTFLLSLYSCAWCVCGVAVTGLSGDSVFSHSGMGPDLTHHTPTHHPTHPLCSKRFYLLSHLAGLKLKSINNWNISYYSDFRNIKDEEKNIKKLKGPK